MRHASPSHVTDFPGHRGGLCAADIGGQLPGNDAQAARAALGRVEVNTARNVAGLDDVTRYLSALYFAPHLTTAGAMAI
jgi:hypothetical protein